MTPLLGIRVPPTISLVRLQPLSPSRMVTPLAYELHLELTPTSGFRLIDVHGASSWEAGDESLVIDVATVFLSRNRGAIVLELDLPYGLA